MSLSVWDCSVNILCTVNVFKILIPGQSEACNDQKTIIIVTQCQIHFMLYGEIKMNTHGNLSFAAKNLQNETDVIRWAHYLGYAGLLPFIASGLLCFVDDPQWQAFAVEALINYAAIIITFTGALHWSRALDASRHNMQALLLLSVTPSIIAWLAMFLSELYALSLLLVLFAVMLKIDMELWGDKHWFVRLRIQLTSGAVLSLVVGAISML